MAEPRQVERLVQHVQRLPQRDEYWVGTHRLARRWVTPRNAPPYRPYLTLFLSQEGKIVRSQVQRYPPTAETLCAELLQAMRRLGWGAGRARRPTRLYVDHPEDVVALTPGLAALQVQCVYRYPLALAEAVIADMERSLGHATLLPGLLSLPAVTPPLLGHLYQLAAQWYQATPWRWLTDHHPLAIRYRPADPPRYAVVMGSGGAVFGLAVYDTLADLQRISQSPLSPKQLAQLVTWCVLFFEEATAMSFEDLDAMAQYAWPVAAPQAYPVFGRTTPTHEIVLPPPSDLLWMEGALAGLVAYGVTPLERRHGEGPPPRTSRSWCPSWVARHPSRFPGWGWTPCGQAHSPPRKALPAERRGGRRTQPVTWSAPGKTEPIEPTSHEALLRSRRPQGPQGARRRQDADGQEVAHEVVCEILDNLGRLPLSFS
jgi:hypothetical protein